MIVISPSLVLSPPAPGYGNPNSPVILWDNRVTLNNVSATSASADYPASNLANPSTALRWQSLSTAVQYLTVSLNSLDDPIDSVGIARHNFGSAGVGVRIEAEDVDDPGVWVVISPEVMPADDAPLLFRFTPTSPSQIRVRLAPTGTAPRAAVLYAGAALLLQRNIYVGHTPIHMGRSTNIQSGTSESGDFLGRVVLQESLSTGVSLQNLTPEWVRTYLLPFIRVAQERPFFFAWRPADYPLEVGYAWLTNDPQPSNQRPNGMMQVDLQMGGVAL